MSSKAKDTFKKLVIRNCKIWVDWLSMDQIRFHSVSWSSSMFRNWASNPLKILSTERFKSSVCKTVRCPFASIYWLFYLKLPHFLSREGEKTRSDRFSCNKDFQCRGAVKTFVGNILLQWVCLLLFHDPWFAWDFSVVGWQRRGVWKCFGIIFASAVDGLDLGQGGGGGGKQ